MKYRAGFTLIEVLIVAVIAISIAAFSVPLYKKSQERNKLTAAQGVLVEIANAMQAIRADYTSAGVSLIDVPRGNTQLTTTHQSTTASSYQEARNFNSIAEVDYSHMPYALFARDYMQPIPYSSGNTYKGYRFYICKAAVSTEQSCCKLSEIACIRKNSSCTKTSDFQGAYIDDDGLLVEVTNNSPEEDRKAVCGLS